MKRIITSFILISVCATTPVAHATVLDELAQKLLQLQGALQQLHTLQSEPVPQVLGVSKNADGYTTFTPSADTRTIYVSSSQGNDSNDGLSAATPKQTIAAGKALLRYGYPDWLLLKKGDVWTDEVIGGLSGNSEAGALQGRSSSEPMLISSYGDGARPLLRVSSGALSSLNRPYGGNYIAIVGLEFYAYKRDPNWSGYDPAQATGSGISLLNSFDWFLFEDNMVRFMQMSVQDRNKTDALHMNNAHIRKNIFYGNYNTNGHAQCIFTYNVKNLVIEENVFDTCGWNSQVTGANSTIFNRSAYLSNGDGKTVYRANIDANGASGGVQNRTGGVVEDNLFLQSPHSIVLGTHQNPPNQHVPGVVRNNVILGSRNIDTQVQGTGIVLASHEYDGSQFGPSYLQNVEVYNNIISTTGDYGPTHNVGAIKVNGNGPYSDVQIFDNIVYNWGSSPGYTGTAIQLNNSSNRHQDFAIYDNIFQQQANGAVLRLRSDFDFTGVSVRGNTIYSPTESLADWQSKTGDVNATFAQVTFSDPDRSIATYMSALGIGGGYDEFMRRAHQQSKDAFDQRFTAAAVNSYIEEGFTIIGQTTPPPTQIPEVTPEPEATPDPAPTPVAEPVANPSPISSTSRVSATDNLNVRVTPAGTLLGVQFRGALGTLDESQERMSRNGYTWVYVNFDSAPDGYVADEFLREVSGTIDTSKMSRKELLALIAQLQQILALLLSVQR